MKVVGRDEAEGGAKQSEMSNKEEEEEEDGDSLFCMTTTFSTCDHIRGGGQRCSDQILFSSHYRY